MLSLPQNVITLPLDECLDLLRARRIGWLLTNGHYLLVHQNGTAKTWARRPNAYKIPVRMGSQTFGALTESTWFDTTDAPYVKRGISDSGEPRFRIFG